MNILETLAVFVGIPGVIYGGIAAATMLPGRSAGRARYQPGQPWNHPPQWWAGDTPVQIPAESAAVGAKRGGARGSW